MESSQTWHHYQKTVYLHPGISFSNPEFAHPVTNSLEFVLQISSNQGFSASPDQDTYLIPKPEGRYIHILPGQIYIPPTANQQDPYPNII